MKKKYWKSQGILSEEKSGNPVLTFSLIDLTWLFWTNLRQLQCITARVRSTTGR